MSLLVTVVVVRTIHLTVHPSDLALCLQLPEDELWRRAATAQIEKVRHAISAQLTWCLQVLTGTNQQEKSSNQLQGPT